MRTDGMNLLNTIRQTTNENEIMDVFYDSIDRTIECIRDSLIQEMPSENIIIEKVINEYNNFK